MAGELAEIIVQGAPRERGEQLGQVLRERIRAFLDDDLARIHRLARRPVHREQLDPVIQEHAQVIRAALPDIAEEIEGIAHGAGIPVLDAFLLQMRRELIAWAGRAEAGDCSTLAVAASDHEPVLGQTVDLQGGMAELAHVLRVRPPPPGVEAVLYTFVGLLGYLGLNSAGLAVGINMVVSDGWTPGVPPYLLVRHLLSLRTIEDCLEALQRIPWSSSRCLTIMDPVRAVQVERAGHELRVLEGPVLLHTNHYLHPELEPLDRVHPLIRRSSRLRLRRLAELVESRRDSGLGPTEVFSLLSDHANAPAAICCHGHGDHRQFETVGAVAILPHSRRLYIRAGPPCEAAEQVFSLERG